jgi:hypothetical protein
VSEQRTSRHTEHVRINGGRQCSGCHRRGETLSLFENRKLYCSTRAESVARLGIELVIRDHEPAALAETSELEDEIDVLDQLDDRPEGDQHEHGDIESTEEHVMADEPVQPQEIGVMPSLATPVLEVRTPAELPPESCDVSFHSVLDAERARLLEQRSALEQAGAHRR